MSEARTPTWVFSLLEWIDAQAAQDPGNMQWELTLESPGAGGRLGRIPWTRLLFRSYAWLDGMRDARLGTDACTPVDASALLARRPIAIGDSVDGGDTTTDMIAAADVDLLLDLRGLGPATPPTHLGCDVWCAQLSEADGGPTIAGTRPVLSAMHAGLATCDVRLTVQPAETRTRAIVSAATVALHPTSLAVSENTCHWKASALFRRALQQATVLGGHRADGASKMISSSEQPIGSRPRGSSGAALGLRLAREATGRLLAIHRRPQWILGIRERVPERRFDTSSGYRTILPPPDRLYADPFIVSASDRNYLFIEEAPFATGKGHISVIEIDDSGLPSAPTPVLEREHHLSYPLVFRDGGDYYMIPETAVERTVNLYRAADFPFHWVFHRVLVEDVRAADASIVVHDGRYWLFASIDTPGHNRNDELSLFSADSLEDEWEPHPRNPVVSDVRCARPAGLPFLYGDELIRPAQDCSTRYGRAVVFRRILTMNDREYAEETTGTLEPTWTAGILGTHTYNANDRFEVVDGLRVIRARG